MSTPWKLHLHGWAVAFDTYCKCRRKKHGAKDPGFKIAANIALNARAIAIRKPFAAPNYGRPWRWFFGNAMKYHKAHVTPSDEEPANPQSSQEESGQ